uniref:Nucleotide-diphospho-sugar transferase domain-containing protein n=1 Tax=Meloidogyne incognita TaxID=6306 RepID=A0A914M1C8_MELIC
MKKEIDLVCELEWRKFDWNIMPKSVHSSQFFAWKIFIMAQIFSEFDTFIWCDTSIQFVEATALIPLFDSIENGSISPVVLPSDNHHGIRFATNPRMYSYLPMITDWINASSKWDSNMYEANLLVFHKSEYTRRFLKWALLCAATQECIEPASSALYCNDHMLGLIGVCHRQDQSVFNILNVNSEYQRWNENNKDEKSFLPHYHKDHPKKRMKHAIQRRTDLDSRIDFKSVVACC